MLKRADLAKQFELVVQQEIINHNSEILASNKSINLLREHMEEIKQTCEAKLARLHSEVILLNTNEDQLKAALSKFIESHKKFCNDFSSELDKLSMHHLNSNKCSESVASELKELKQDLDSLRDDIVSMKSENSSFQDSTNGALDMFLGLVNKKINAAKEEILSIPSEAKKVREDLEEKMSIDRVDFKGVIKELEAVKKKAFIQEKYIEKIMTDLDKLKDRQSP